MRYDVKPNSLRAPAENRNKIIEDNKDLVEASANTAKNDDYVFYTGAYNGPTNKTPDIRNGKPAERPEENFFNDEDFWQKDDDEKDEKWGKDFVASFQEEVAELGERIDNQVTTNQARGKIATGQNGNNPNYAYDKSDPTGFMYRYNNLEDYYGTEGKNAYENAEKGTMNNLRSVLGEMVGRGAFLINDWLPNKNAQKILENNEAETYAKMADNYFDLAKEETGEYGDRLINNIEDASEEAGYNIFGFGLGDVFKSVDTGFKAYEELINEGVPKEQALLISAAKGGFEFAKEKLLGYGSKWLGDHIPKGNTLDIVYGNDYNRANQKGDLINEYHDLLTKQEWAQIYDYIARNGKLNAKIGDRFVWTINGIKILFEKVKIGKDASDYQIINYEYLD